jgi:hypothetical protein
MLLDLVNKNNGIPDDHAPKGQDFKTQPQSLKAAIAG